VPEHLERLRIALAGRYTIERELGRGGNAIVYLAHDPKHGRQVALKVLLPELALSVRAERFLREIQIAAQLTHPHILPLYDSGAAEGILYYVMPYVEGESLRDRLQREPQLPLADALQIAREVADALSYAHQHDVIHRDIKPENILLHAGHALVADFGIARALAAADSQTATQTGIVVGTPVYMSPEQAMGNKAIDGRSDVYSLGCVLYEMLAGKPPFAGDTPQEIVAHHVLDPVPPLRKLRREVPPAVEDAILTALAKPPAERFLTADAFTAALADPEGQRSGTRWRRVQRASRRTSIRVYAGVGLSVLLLGWWLAAHPLRSHAGVTATAEQSLAVLPFVNMSGDTANEYLSDGMTEELINALVQIPGLRVPARTSAFVFKGKTEDIRDIGRRLNVARLVEGSVQRAGTRLRVTAQLIDVNDGYHVWSETYDRELRDVFNMQDELVRAIAGAVQVKLAGAPALERHATDNVAAYDAYLRSTAASPRAGSRSARP
jgi:TolB-like protein/tRNA A-37 threonylcarbamoyl transferase component Bud32